MRPLELGYDAVGYQRIEAGAWILTTSDLKFGGGATPCAEIVARIRRVASVVNTSTQTSAIRFAAVHFAPKA